MKPIDLNKYTEKLVEQKIADEVDRRVDIKVDAMLKFITLYMRDSIRKHKISEDRADKIVADLLGELENRG
jgi:hypothetical protein